MFSGLLNACGVFFFIIEFKYLLFFFFKSKLKLTHIKGTTVEKTTPNSKQLQPEIKKNKLTKQ